MIGRRIGRYELVAELGRGGMGVVYKARDSELGRYVALKSLPAERSLDPERRRRFLAEARAASALSHPNIVTVHDLLSLDGEEWIVLELVEGETLAERIRPGGLPLSQALGWAATIAEALAAAHQAGIVHRDLKPGNVMVDRHGRLRVLDFGLAKLLLPETVSGHEPTQSELPMTRAGALLGTLEYMSPEQALGKPVDARSDIFSLGAVFYELLTGRRPFAGESAAAKIHAVVYEEPEPLASLRPELPAPVAAIVARALAKDPDERFATMAELAAALRRIESGSSAPTAFAEAPPPPRPAAAPTPPRRLGPRIALAIVAIALIAVGAWLVWLAPKEGSDVASGAAAPPSALPDTPFALFETGQGLLALHWRAGYVDRALEAFQRAVALDSAYAPAYAGLAAAFLRKHQSERDPIWLERASAQAQQALALDPNLAAARLARAQVLLARKESDAAEGELRELLVRHPAEARAYRGLADVAAARRRGDEAESLYRQAIARAPRDPELESALGTFLFDAGRYGEAAEAFGRATAAASDFVFGYRNAAAALHMLGRYEEAATQLQRALEIRPDAPSYSNLGTLYFFQALYPQALAAYERAIALGANDYLIWANLGDAHRFTPGHTEQARRAYTRALQLLAEESGERAAEPATASRRALLLAKQGSANEAVALAERLLATASEPSVLYRLTLAFELSGRRERALQALGRALAAGYSAAEIRQDPELTGLREDPNYHLMMVDAAAAAARPR